MQVAQMTVRDTLRDVIFVTAAEERRKVSKAEPMDRL